MFTSVAKIIHYSFYKPLSVSQGQLQTVTFNVDLTPFYMSILTPHSFIKYSFTHMAYVSC